MLFLTEAVHSSQSSQHRGNHGDDDPLLQLETTLRTDVIVNQQEGCGLTRRMQAWLYYYVALPVIRGRWLMFGES